MSRITMCPHRSKRIRVSEQITDKTLICPHCLADMDNAWPGSQIRANDINTGVKRDVNVGGIILAVLIGLCILGIVMAMIGANPDAGMGLLMISCATLDVLVSITIICWGISDVVPRFLCLVQLLLSSFSLLHLRGTRISPPP